MARQEILLLNTLESRELKKNGVLIVERNGLRLTLSYDKATKTATITSSEAVGVVWVDPYASSYDVKLTQAESKEYHEKGEVIIERANNTYLLKNGVCVPVMSYNMVYVR